MPRTEYQILQANIGEPELGDVQDVLVQRAPGGRSGLVCTARVLFKDVDGNPRTVNASPEFTAKWTQPAWPTVAQIQAQVLAQFQATFAVVV